MAFKMKGFSLHQGTSPAKAFTSAAQRKAVWASKNERSGAKMLGDLDKDGDMSGYETARQNAIDKNSPNKQRLNKGGEGQDQNKIFNKKGEHVGDYVNGKKVMHTKAQHAKVMKLDSPAKNKEESKVKTTRTKNSITKSDGKKSSTYNIDNSKTKDNKDGSKSYTFTNDLGNSINETHSSSPATQKDNFLNTVKKSIPEAVKALANKNPKPNFQMHSTDINGMKKKSGFGPKAAKGKDDQSKELAKSKFEMGEYDKDPTSPAKNKKESKVKTTRTKNSITKSDGKTSSTYNIDNSKTKENKDGSKSYTFTNDLGNSINETHSSSPLAQKIIGGTKSKKGNIFTKRGRTQRTINQVGKAKDKLRDNANKEGFDTKKSKRLMKKALKKGEKAVKKVNKYFGRNQYKGVKFAGDDGMDKN